MAKDLIKVLHVDTGKSWRGGQQQAAYLYLAMCEHGYETALICQPRSAFEQFCRDKKLPHYLVKMWGEIDFSAGLKIAHLCRKHGAPADTWKRDYKNIIVSTYRAIVFEEERYGG